MSFAKRGTRGGIKASGGVGALGGVRVSVEALSLPTLDLLAGLWPASSSNSSARLAGVLIQELWQT